MNSHSFKSYALFGAIAAMAVAAQGMYPDPNQQPNQPGYPPNFNPYGQNQFGQPPAGYPMAHQHAQVSNRYTQHLMRVYPGTQLTMKELKKDDFKGLYGEIGWVNLVSPRFKNPRLMQNDQKILEIENVLRTYWKKIDFKSNNLMDYYVKAEGNLLRLDDQEGTIKFTVEKLSDTEIKVTDKSGANDVELVTIEHAYDSTIKKDIYRFAATGTDVDYLLAALCYLIDEAWFDKKNRK